nr:uncharacterized protein LOC117692276 isoform X1 [Crassostrea gigas]XP_034335665.1 uncharacterized protein LOC117692276 isoform X1 [Crassostrea gigas]
MGIYTYLIVVLLLTQGSICALQYCPEAVASVEVVKFCPTTEKELDRAAKRKNCDKLATSQNCSSIENFVYHCTINSYRNATLEVCAPKRTILGHCTEFNIVGGVIQDQHSAPCSVTFPKCDKYYTSNDAYKYDDCYKLVQSARVLQNETTTEKNWIKTGFTLEETLIICFLVFVLAVTVVGVVTFLVLRRRCSTTQSDQAKNKKDQRSSKADQDDLPTQQLLDENPTPSATSPVINPNARDDDKKKALGCNTTESNQAKNKKDQRSSKADQDDLPTQQLLDENPTPSATSPVINPNARDDDRKKALDSFLRNTDRNLQKFGLKGAFDISIGSVSLTSKGSSEYADALEKQPEDPNTNCNHPSTSSQKYKDTDPDEVKKKFS